MSYNMVNNFESKGLLFVELQIPITLIFKTVRDSFPPSSLIDFNLYIIFFVL